MAAATIWKGHLSFGLVSIPVRLFRAARAERVSLREVHRSGRRGKVVEMPAPGAQPQADRVEPVRHAAVPESGEEPIPASEVAKGYEYEPERWVVLEREEIKSLAPKTSTVLEIGVFVPLAEIDPIYYESSYYVVPEKTGEKAYAILHRALRETGMAAMGELAMRGRQHVFIVRAGDAGLIAHTMYYTNEVHREAEYRADHSLVSERELDLARTLVKTLAGPFEPEKYQDRYREQLEKLIASKVEGREIHEGAPKPAAAPVGDLMQALEQSLAAARKPPAGERQPAKKPRHRTAGR